MQEIINICFPPFFPYYNIFSLIFLIFPILHAGIHKGLFQMRESNMTGAYFIKKSLLNVGLIYYYYYYFNLNL